MGTCSSMPVLYVAVGRRLAYPVSLARAKEHLFVRWEGAGESFNIEATNKGLNVHPDKYYHQWPKPLSQADLQSGAYLRPLNSREELATFLALRRYCLRANDREADAEQVYSIAKTLLTRE